jgi:hypothetical protein
MDLATRLTHEAEFHQNSWFVTLTYDPEHLPHGGSLRQAHISTFVKALRKKVPSKVRYFGVGEYGGKFGRPHLHLILFGPDFPDRKQEYIFPHSSPMSAFGLAAPGGTQYFTSDLLSSIWKKGKCQLTRTSEATMQYVSKFHIDKITGDKAVEFYTSIADNGELVELEQEQSRMSTNPGLGRKWIEKNWRYIYPHGYITQRGGAQFSPPKYYDKWLEKNHPAQFIKLKKNRDQLVDPLNHIESHRKAVALNRSAALSLGVSIGKGNYKGPGVSQNELTQRFKESQRPRR